MEETRQRVYILELYLFELNQLLITCYFSVQQKFPSLSFSNSLGRRNGGFRRPGVSIGKCL